MTYKVSIYKTKRKEWRWKIKASNNRIIAASTESYKNRIDCRENLLMIKAALADFGNEVLKFPMLDLEQDEK